MKTLKLWNGRGSQAGGRRIHLYICALSKSEACKMLTKAYGGNVGRWRREMDTYFSSGCWGNSMKHITLEIGIWEEDEKTNIIKKVL